MYRPSPKFQAKPDLPQHYPSICQLSPVANISTCSFLQSPVGLEASPSPRFTSRISAQAPQASNPHFQTFLWSLVKGKHSRNFLSLGYPTHRPRPGVKRGGSGPWGHSQEADPGPAETGPTALSTGTGRTQQTRGWFSWEGLSQPWKNGTRQGGKSTDVWKVQTPRKERITLARSQVF